MIAVLSVYSNDVQNVGQLDPQGFCQAPSNVSISPNHRVNNGISQSRSRPVYLRVMPMHKVPDKVREGLLLDGVPDLGCQPLCVSNIVQGDEAGGKRQASPCSKVVQKCSAVVLAC